MILVFSATTNLSTQAPILWSFVEVSNSKACHINHNLEDPVPQTVWSVGISWWNRSRTVSGAGLPWRPGPDVGNTMEDRWTSVTVPDAPWRWAGGGWPRVLPTLHLRSSRSSFPIWLMPFTSKKAWRQHKYNQQFTSVKRKQQQYWIGEHQQCLTRCFWHWTQELSKLASKLLADLRSQDSKPVSLLREINQKQKQPTSKQQGPAPAFRCRISSKLTRSAPAAGKRASSRVPLGPRRPGWQGRRRTSGRPVGWIGQQVVFTSVWETCWEWWGLLYTAL